MSLYVATEKLQVNHQVTVSAMHSDWQEMYGARYFPSVRIKAYHAPREGE
jgi:hypothetical protein